MYGKKLKLEAIEEQSPAGLVLRLLDALYMSGDDREVAQALCAAYIRFHGIEYAAQFGRSCLEPMIKHPLTGKLEQNKFYDPELGKIMASECERAKCVEFVEMNAEGEWNIKPTAEGGPPGNLDVLVKLSNRAVLDQ